MAERWVDLDLDLDLEIKELAAPPWWRESDIFIYIHIYIQRERERERDTEEGCIPIGWLNFHWGSLTSIGKVDFPSGRLQSHWES